MHPLEDIEDRSWCSAPSLGNSYNLFHQYIVHSLAISNKTHVLPLLDNFKGQFSYFTLYFSEIFERPKISGALQMYKCFNNCITMIYFLPLLIEMLFEIIQLQTLS